MKKKYKLVYKEGSEKKTVISNDPQVLLIVLNEKIPAYVSQYRNTPSFELISYGETSED